MAEYAAQGYNSIAKTAMPANSLVHDSASIVDRLQKIQSHLIDLGNKLHGSQPRDAGDSGAKIEPEPTLRRNLDKACSWLCEIEAELQRIDARV